MDLIMGKFRELLKENPPIRELAEPSPFPFIESKIDKITLMNANTIGKKVADLVVARLTAGNVSLVMQAVIKSSLDSLEEKFNPSGDTVEEDNFRKRSVSGGSLGKMKETHPSDATDGNFRVRSLSANNMPKKRDTSDESLSSLASLAEDGNTSPAKIFGSVVAGKRSRRVSYSSSFTKSEIENIRNSVLTRVQEKILSLKNMKKDFLEKGMHFHFLFQGDICDESLLERPLSFPFEFPFSKGKAIENYSISIECNTDQAGENDPFMVFLIEKRKNVEVAREEVVIDF